MTYIDEVRARLNPQRWSVTDVMAGRTRIERSWLKVFQVQRGAALWSSVMCWLALGASGSGLGVLFWAVVRGLGR